MRKMIEVLIEKYFSFPVQFVCVDVLQQLKELNVAKK